MILTGFPNYLYLSTGYLSIQPVQNLHVLTTSMYMI